MHREPAGGFRYIPVAQLVDALNMLPPYPVCRYKLLRRSRWDGAPEQSCCHLIGIRRLGQIINCSSFHGLDRGGDVPIPGEHDDAAQRAHASQLWNKVQTILSADPHIENGKGWWLAVYEGSSVNNGSNRSGFEPAFVESPAQALP